MAAAALVGYTIYKSLTNDDSSRYQNGCNQNGHMYAPATTDDPAAAEREAAQKALETRKAELMGTAN